MKNSKKILNLVLILSSGLLLAGCNDKKNTGKPDTTKTSQKGSDTTVNSTTAGSNGGNNNSATTEVSDKNVNKLEVKTNPTKMEYVLGETFNPEGGVLKVTYKNKSTADLPMTDSRVTISNLNTASVGTKSLKITFGGKSVTLRNILVTREKLDVTFNTNGGSAIEVIKAEKGTKLTKPANPTKAGFDFDGWFTDEDLTMAYDFDSVVEAPITLYAKWLTSGAVKHVVTFDYDFYGVVPSTRTLNVEDGKTTKKLSQDPTRLGYDFKGWTKDGVDFDFTSKVNTDITLKAKWERSSSVLVGTQTYKFEAEDIDFTGVTGAGLSGTTTGAGSIVKMPGFGASQDMYVSYMYKENNLLKFQVISDVDIANVQFKASMSQELENYTYTPSNYAISVNGTSVNYGQIAFDKVPAREGDLLKPQQFAEYTLGTVSLKKGNNLITFMTANHDAISGTTMLAHAPLLDYISLTCDNAVLQWDNVLGYPVADNY